MMEAGIQLPLSRVLKRRRRRQSHEDTESQLCDSAKETPRTIAPTPRNVGIDLYWLPLGAGGNFVRLNGRVYEAIKSRLQRRPAFALYHSGLEVLAPEGRYVIEQTPVVNSAGPDRGVVAEGPVGARWAGHWRIFRYEVRRWLNGRISDVGEAVDSPQRLSNDTEHVRRLLELVPKVPILVWGRDEAQAGEMWNSNSIIAWLLARSGLETDSITPPAGGRAPGWNAGILVARRQRDATPQAISSVPVPAHR